MGKTLPARASGENTHIFVAYLAESVFLCLPLYFSALSVNPIEKRCGGAVIDSRTALRSSSVLNGHRRRRSRFLLLYAVY